MPTAIKILTIVGARPQFVKAAVVSRAIQRHNAAKIATVRIDEVLLHTGQHYDINMSRIFFQELGIPEPTINLQIGSGSHAQTTGQMLVGIETEIQQRKPDLVLVYGDTNSTLAGALAAAKLHVPVVHVEAGLRSFNKAMPEEVNRILTDHISTILFCPTRAAVRNLRDENIVNGVEHVGDVMFDAARLFATVAEENATVLQRLRLTPKTYVLATIHRAENTDDPQRLDKIMRALARIGGNYAPVLLPMHPRTRGALKREKLLDAHGKLVLPGGQHVSLVDPVSFIDMVALEKSAKLIVTDSGGVQKEAYFHGVPCVTLRAETEWVETVQAGWNQLAGCDSDQICACVERAAPGTPIDDYGDGTAANDIVQFLARTGHPG